MAGSEVFTTCHMTMRFKVKIWNSDVGKLKKYNVGGGGGQFWFICVTWILYLRKNCDKKVRTKLYYRKLFGFLSFFCLVWGLFVYLFV